jgi:ubiquinone/menaquinone biosynthesis C-methylase UbiE
MARVDYEQMASAYDAGRALTLAALEPWRVALAPHLLPTTSLPVLDLGSGTGQFATAFAEWFGTHVIGVEPAAGMRREARRKRSHPHVAYVGGEAERIPLRDGSCGCAWLSTVVHHIGDLRGCAHELRRVLQPHGRVLVRSSFPGRQDQITLFRFFPSARKIAETFPTVEATAAAFAAAGFELESLESVSQVSAPSLRAFSERVRLRTDSTLRPLPDETFAEGMAMLERAIATESSPVPVVDRLDLVVLRKRRTSSGGDVR